MRVFIALRLSEAFRNSLTAACAPLRTSSPGLRWVRAEAMHLTLAFLGELDVAGVTSAFEAMRSAVDTMPAGKRGPLTLAASGLLTFPPRGRATVLAAAIGPGSAEAEALATGIEDSLERVGNETGRRFRPREARRLTPHVTLARASRPGFTLSPAERTIHPDATCIADRLVLFRSIPGPGGSSYEPLGEVLLA